MLGALQQSTPQLNGFRSHHSALLGGQGLFITRVLLALSSKTITHTWQLLRNASHNNANAYICQLSYWVQTAANKINTKQSLAGVPNPATEPATTTNGNCNNILLSINFKTTQQFITTHKFSTKKINIKLCI